jgi:hypothetical protein
LGGSAGKGAGEKEHSVAMRESLAGDSGVTTLVQQIEQFRQALGESPATLAAATMVTADEATAATFVAKLGVFRGSLNEDERRLLDGLLAVASLGTGDVEAYGLSGLGARQVALAAVMLLGVATATLGTATSGTAHAAPSDGPSLNNNMGGSNMSGGSMGGSNTGGSNMSGGTRGPNVGGTVPSGGTTSGGTGMSGGTTTAPPTMSGGQTRPPGTGPSIVIDVSANGINIHQGGPGGVTVRGGINNPDPFLEAIRQAEAEQAAAQAAAAQAAAAQAAIDARAAAERERLRQQAAAEEAARQQAAALEAERLRQQAEAQAAAERERARQAAVAAELERQRQAAAAAEQQRQQAEAQAAAAQAAANQAAAQAAAQRPPLTESDFTSAHTQHAPPIVPTATNEHDHRVFQQAAASQINREIAATEAARDNIQGLTERARTDAERDRLSQLFQDLTTERERLLQRRENVLGQVWSAQNAREAQAVEAARRAHEEEVRNPTTEEGMVENIERARESERTQAQRADQMLPPGMRNWTQ